MDNNKINEIQDLLEDEEFKVDNFEFKLWNIRSSWVDSLFFDFKVHNPNDESFCRKCLEESLYDELKPYLKYLGLEEKVFVNIFDKNEKLEPFYITDDFINGLFDEIKKITDINHDDEYDDLVIKIKQEPTKITLEEYKTGNDLSITIYAKYIDHYITRDGNFVGLGPLNKGNLWSVFKEYNSFGEDWYHDVITNYVEKFRSMGCVGFFIATHFI
jgi:hypothetical protein